MITGVFSSLICFNDFVHTAPIWSAPYINMRQYILFLSLKSSEEKKDKFIDELLLSYKSVYKIICMLSDLSRWTENWVVFASLRVLSCDLKKSLWPLERVTSKQFILFIHLFSLTPLTSLYAPWCAPQLCLSTLKGPFTPLFLFTCENLTIVFVRSMLKRKKSLWNY